MRTAIDARIISDKMHGIARYVHKLILALSEIDHENEYIILYNNETFRSTITLPDNFSFLKCGIKLYSVQEQFLIPRLLKKERIDIYHSPTFSAPLFSHCKVIMTIHDMIHLVFSEHYSLLKNLYYKTIVKTAAHKASRIITDSESSKKDIVRFLTIPDDKIRSIYIGFDDKVIQNNADISKSDIMQKYGIPGEFVLFVGNEKPHKNAENVIKAFELFFIKSRTAHSLVLIGISKKFVEEVTGCDFFDSIIPFDSINNDDDLFSIYRASSLLLYPSRYEGFGLPILEAMACGAPVITSNNSSIPEVAGDATIMVDPENIEQIADEIARALSDTNLRKDAIEKGKTRAALFT